MEQPFKTHPNDSVDNGEGYDKWIEGHGALSKREYFASHALMGLLASDETGSTAGHAEDAVKIADDLIKELNKEKDNG